MKLNDFFVHHLKQRDLHLNELEYFEVFDDYFILKNKKKSFYELGYSFNDYYKITDLNVFNELSSFFNKKVLEYKKSSKKLVFSYLVFFNLNSVSNFVLDNLEFFSEHFYLKIFFINPLSSKKYYPINVNAFLKMDLNRNFVKSHLKKDLTFVSESNYKRFEKE